MKERGKILFDTVKRHKSGFFVYFLSAAGCGLVFFLYGLPLEPFFYAFAVLAVLSLFLFGSACLRAVRRAEERERLLRSVLLEPDCLPAPENLAQEDLYQAIRLLQSELNRLRAEYERDRQEETDYYTAWVHQIKTPIAVMRLTLGAEDTPDRRALETELFRIEQYVEMVLQYIRLGSGTNDLFIREYPLDGLIRESIRKFAPQFIGRRLGLHYEGTGCTVITDKKWFACILEQLLSNAIKYTPEGGITIEEKDGELRISDTGVGIATEDLPLIFEKGYTGRNGRMDKCSSGLGLYLCRRAAKLINIPIRVESEPGKGSSFFLDLKEHLAPEGRN